MHGMHLSSFGWRHQVTHGCGGSMLSSREDTYIVFSGITETDNFAFELWLYLCHEGFPPSGSLVNSCGFAEINCNKTGLHQYEEETYTTFVLHFALMMFTKLGS